MGAAFTVVVVVVDAMVVVVVTVAVTEKTRKRAEGSTRCLLDFGETVDEQGR